jgi:hypothetical protein
MSVTSVNPPWRIWSRMDSWTDLAVDRAWRVSYLVYLRIYRLTKVCRWQISKFFPVDWWRKLIRRNRLYMEPLPCCPFLPLQPTLHVKIQQRPHLYRRHSIVRQGMAVIANCNAVCHILGLVEGRVSCPDDNRGATQHKKLPFPARNRLGSLLRVNTRFLVNPFLDILSFHAFAAIERTVTASVV